MQWRYRIYKLLYCDTVKLIYKKFILKSCKNDRKSTSIVTILITKLKNTFYVNLLKVTCHYLSPTDFDIFCSNKITDFLVKIGPKSEVKFKEPYSQHLFC